MREQICFWLVLLLTGSILLARADKATPDPIINSVTPDRGIPGSSVLIHLLGSNLDPNLNVAGDSNIKVSDKKVIPSKSPGQNQFTFELAISQTATMGNHTLPVTVSSGSKPLPPIIFTVSGPTIKISPLTAKPGDTLKLIATADNCPADPLTHGWLNKDSLTVSGNEIGTTYLLNDECSVTYNAVVAPTPLNRELTINVTGLQPKPSSPAKGDAAASSPKATNLGNSTFRILDAIPPGAIPPGINPQVDVSWTVMSEKACSDEFGTRLAKYYFCINVVLGNNSGYPLILAAVAFLRHVNNTDFRDSTASYVATRAMVQYGQVISARALSISTLQAAGAIIAGSVGFSGNAGRQGRIALWSTLVGSVAAGVIGAVIPDRTQAEDTSLDDEALRDGRLIPNNSPVRFAVFVDRDEVKPLLLRNSKQLDQTLVSCL